MFFASVAIGHGKYQGVENADALTRMLMRLTAA
jgi:hypothetical protein